ncbi:MULTISPECIES: hypothetical protein [unclassified Streptomyces]|uniref:hypothetical protein n=1 Tax=unclassified Streptomyces TaxID=2593676 RepID=UPI00380313F5
MLWSHVMAAIAEEYLGRRFGPLMGLGVVLVVVGSKARSSYAMCVGGVLVLLVLVSYGGR